MRNKKLGVLAVSLISLFVFSLIGSPFSYVFAQQNLEKDEDIDNEVEVVQGTELWNGTRSRIEKLIEIMVKARNHVQTIFSAYNERGLEIPEQAQNVLDRSINKSKSAINLFEEGELAAAGRTALSAMKDFRESIKLLKTSQINGFPIPPRRISHAINRTIMFVERLEAITEKAGEQGYNVTDILEKIKEAKTILNNATQLLSNDQVEEAARKLGEAKRIISEIIRDFNQISKNDRLRRINDFIDKSIDRLNKIEQKSEDLFPPQVANRIKNSIEKAKTHLEQAKNNIIQKRFPQAIDQLDEMVKDSEEGLRLFPR